MKLPIGVLKQLLDPDKFKMHFKSLGLDLDISHATYFLDGNYELDEDLGAGGRLKQMNFLSMTSETKKKATIDVLEKELLIVEKSYGTDAVGTIKTALISRVDDLIRKEEVLGSPGAKAIQQIVKNASYWMATKINEQKTYDLDAYIEGEFKSMQENEKKYAHVPLAPGLRSVGGQRGLVGSSPSHEGQGDSNGQNSIKADL